MTARGSRNRNGQAFPPHRPNERIHPAFIATRLPVRVVAVAATRVLAVVLLLAVAPVVALEWLTSHPPPESLGRTAAEWAARVGDVQPAVRDSAVVGLGELLPYSAITIRAGAAGLLDSDAHVRRAAAQVLVSAGRAEGHAAAAVIRAVEQVLQARDPVGRVAAARVLGTLGSVARTSVPALLQALGDSIPDVRDAAATALGSVVAPVPPSGAQSLTVRLVLSRLVIAARDTADVVREAALEAVGRVAPLDPRLRSLVRRALEDPSPLVRDRARGILTPGYEEHRHAFD